MKAVRPDNLEIMLQDIVDEYSEEVAETLKKEAKSAAKEAVKELKQTSPKKTGKYGAGWTSRVTQESAGSITVTVYNQKKPGLVHLLENGHARRGGGRTEGKPHVEPAADAAVETFVRKVESKL